MIAVVGLGSSSVHASRQIERGFESLRTCETLTLCGKSRVVRSPPVGGKTSAQFANAAAVVVTRLLPLGLLGVLRSIETRFGRVRTEANASRPLDLDILWIVGRRVALSTLQVPHRGLAERSFATGPAVEALADAGICPPPALVQMALRGRGAPFSSTDAPAPRTARP